MFNEYPYRNLTDLNLDYLLNQIGKITREVNEFVSLNTIKYADPISWDITSQYGKNTVVIDSQTGTAYISSKPVPIGVSLSDTGYWSVIFDLGRFITLASQNFANSYESVLTTTATMETTKGGWVVWDSVLYEALNDIHIGDRYVIDGNIKRRTVEAFYKELAARVAQEIADRIAADASLQQNIDDEATARQQADAQLQQNIDNEVAARQQAIEELTQSFNTAIANEATARENEDLTLSNRIARIWGRNVVIVGRGTDYETINSALPNIRQVVSLSNPILMIIKSGVYVEELDLTGVNGLTVVGVGHVMIQSTSTYPMANIYITGSVELWNLHLLQLGDAYNIHCDTQGTTSPVKVRMYNCVLQRTQGAAGTYQHNIGWGACDVGGDNYDIFNCNFIGGTGIGGHVAPASSATGTIVWRVANCTFNVERAAIDWVDACKMLSGVASAQHVVCVFTGNSTNKGVIIQTDRSIAYNYFPASGTFVELLVTSGGNSAVAMNGVRPTVNWILGPFGQMGTGAIITVPFAQANKYTNEIAYAKIISSSADIQSACAIYSTSPNGVHVQCNNYSAVGANAVQIGIRSTPTIDSILGTV